MLKRTFIYFLLGVLLLIAPVALAQTSFIEHFDTKDGLPSNICFYSLQDSKGYIWVGTDAGVSRFDGHYFTNYTIEDGLPDNQILQIKEDRIGRVWFLSFSGKLSFHYNGKIYNEANSQLIRLLRLNEIIVSFFEDNEGRIWFGTNKNLLYQFDGKRLVKFVSRNVNKQFLNASVQQDQHGNIWVITKHVSMLYKNKGFYEVTSMPKPISYRTIYNNAARKLQYLDVKGLRSTSNGFKEINFNIPGGMLNDKLGYIYANDQELWLSNNEGVFEFRKGEASRQYLHNIPTSQVIKDSDQNMWFTTFNGIYMLRREENRMYIFNQTQGLTSNYIKSISEDRQHRLWLGLNNGTINVLDIYSSRLKKIQFSNLGINNDIKQLLLDSTRGYMFFSTNQTLGKIGNIYSRSFDTDLLKEKSNSILAIKNMSLSSKNELAIATASGVFLINDPVKAFQFNARNVTEGVNFYNNRAYSVFYDKNGALWFSNTDGLKAVGYGNLQSEADRNYFKEKRIYDIKEAGNGIIVIATDGFGLAYIQDGKIIKKLTIENGLADNICKKLFMDGSHLWVITNKGINNICLDGAHPEVQGYEYTSALLKNDVNDLFISKDTAYFATNNGLVYFQKRDIEKKNKSPRVIVSSVLNNGNILEVRDSLVSLDPDRNNITFTYSALDFQNQDLIYRYRLKTEDNWTETRNRRLEFSSLAPGSYIFQVSSKSSNTEWSDPTRIKFKLEEHFWQRNWFIFVLLLAASFSFYKIAVIITKWQKNQEQKQLVLKNKILILEQRALLAMMNPHFIFNVMNSIQYYINTKDTSSANKVLTGFAKLIRKNLEICTKSFISIEEELEYLTLYLALEKKRFGDKFSYKVTIDPAIDQEELFIPSMLLQPYVENAIWHGIMPKEQGGNIEITMEVIDQEFLLIYIIDDGVGIDNSTKFKKEHHSSKGMNMTQERVNLLNQIESIYIQISITQRGDAGTIVTIQVPI